MNWIEIGTVDSIPTLGARIIRTAKDDIAVFRTAADEIFALDDKCPHKGGPLSQGIVHGRFVTCPLHNFVIGLDNGQARAPDKGCTRAHNIRVTDGVIFLGIDESVAVI